MYYIIEIKSNKTGEESAVCPLLGYTDKDKATSAYYYKLVYASDPDLSQVELHTVMLIDHLGQTLMCNVFQHEYPAPEPEPEPEPEPTPEPEPEPDPDPEPTPDPEPEEDAPAEESEEVEEEVPEEEPVEEPIEEEQEEPEDVGSL